jgi:DNA polymerase-3 subunit beta
MKFSTLQENLKSGLQIVAHAASKNINLPILNNILIEVANNNIKLISTNLEIGIVHSIRGKIDAEGKYTIDAKIINDYIALLPNKKVEVKLDKEQLIVECDNYKIKMKGQSSEEYPLIPQIEKNEGYIVKKSVLKESLSQVVFAVSTSETRMELSGVLFNFSGKKLFIAATDSYRLAEKEMVVLREGVEEEKKIIIPAKTIQEVIRIFSTINEESAGDNVKIYISDNQVMFADNNTELISRLIEGQFPDYQQIIPKNPKTNIITNRAGLVRAIKASSLFSKTGINDVNLDFPQEKNQIVVSSISGSTGESVIVLEALVKGSDNGVIVNHRYLIDGLNNINTENIKIEVIDNNTPCILRPEEVKKEVDGGVKYLYIIMPIKQ